MIPSGRVTSSRVGAGVIEAEVCLDRAEVVTPHLEALGWGHELRVAFVLVRNYWRSGLDTLEADVINDDGGVRRVTPCPGDWLVGEDSLVGVQRRE